MDVEKISEALKDRNLSRVADATGLHRNTLSRIKSGKSKWLSAGTLKILTDYLAPSA
jgi:transcriptional regulator with XRE-family HTH domain